MLGRRVVLGLGGEAVSERGQGVAEVRPCGVGGDAFGGEDKSPPFAESDSGGGNRQGAAGVLSPSTASRTALSVGLDIRAAKQRLHAARSSSVKSSARLSSRKAPILRTICDARTVGISGWPYGIGPSGRSTTCTFPSRTP